MFLLPFFSLLLVFLFSFLLITALLPRIFRQKKGPNALHDIWLDEHAHVPDGYMLAASRPEHLT